VVGNEPDDIEPSQTAHTNRITSTSIIPPFLELKNIWKSFGGVKALRGVSFTLESGRIYHLMGENGCGKSTLIKILSGAQKADKGQILLDGKRLGVCAGDSGPIGALRAGIETVYQDLSLLPNLSVAENIALTGQLVDSGGRLGRRLKLAALRDCARQALAEIHLPTDADFLERRVDRLPLAVRQLVAIARTIATQARLVIMDEPTTALTRKEVNALRQTIERLLHKGVAVLFVSHKLEESKLLGGQAIIMRDGAKIAELDVATHSAAEFAQWMTGRDISQQRYRQVKGQASKGAALLDVEQLGDGESFCNASFSLRRGEILGITGLQGCGRNELVLALAGIRPARSGKINFEGREIMPGSAADAIGHGIAYVPEDRLTEGLFLEKSIQDNIILPIFSRLRNVLGAISLRRAKVVAQTTVDDLQIVTSDVALPVSALSGGNQQRVLIGRWLTIQPRLLILNGPSVGVDVGAKDTIFRIIQRLAESGMGVILVSDDVPELLQNCDRVLVMSGGRIVACHEGENLNEENVYASIVENA